MIDVRDDREVADVFAGRTHGGRDGKGVSALIRPHFGVSRLCRVEDAQGEVDAQAHVGVVQVEPVARAKLLHPVRERVRVHSRSAAAASFMR